MNILRKNQSHIQFIKLIDKLTQYVQLKETKL